MGARATLCYGIRLGEDQDSRVPWRHTSFNEWWARQTGFEIEQPKHVTVPFNQQVLEYSRAFRKWLDEHPAPVELVEYGDYQTSMYILAVPGSVQCMYDEPVKLQSSNHAPYDVLVGVTQEQIEALRAFCEQYGIIVEPRTSPGFWLVSNWE